MQIAHVRFYFAFCSSTYRPRVWSAHRLLKEVTLGSVIGDIVANSSHAVSQPHVFLSPRSELLLQNFKYGNSKIFPSYTSVVCNYAAEEKDGCHRHCRHWRSRPATKNRKALCT